MSLLADLLVFFLHTLRINCRNERIASGRARPESSKSRSKDEDESDIKFINVEAGNESSRSERSHTYNATEVVLHLYLAYEFSGVLLRRDIIVICYCAFTIYVSAIFFCFQLAKCGETDYHDVYEIDLHGCRISDIPNLEKVTLPY